MTEMPVPPKWLENNPLAQSLKDQTIRIPIAGTLKSPQLDRSVMEQLTRQFIKSAAKNIIEDGLNRGSTACSNSRNNGAKHCAFLSGRTAACARGPAAPLGVCGRKPWPLVAARALGKLSWPL